ncbi:hypothetical protein ACF8FG_05345 [Pseudomonas sp. YQ_6]|uniref:hypothetical protein n=1 Tax=Pseudomonas TaxID=286 RepID=UPI0001F31808|nr:MULTISPECIES: hypothetical protein [Pseudomonas]ADR60725.1 Hypothetical protein, conserved [Pseudomonas putida BIRD-1]AOX09762.1 hypothetical protein Q5O_15595 [Pseudomonas putida JB]MCI1021762.1 hypothetical protein [Pseudomonas putida]MDN4513777.1 hypothetical protein [Pseudomonas sp. 2,4-D]MDW2775740.1 hypothetical protein [Pseudomonas sp. BEA3.1]
MDYSTAELVKWLGEETRLLGWDMVFFIDGGKINALLKQTSIRRFNTANRLPPISGFIGNGPDYRFALSNCSLTLPRLIFDVNLAGNKAHLLITIAEANAYALMFKSQQWQVRQLDVLGGVQNADLSLDIDLEASGGHVDETDTIRLDLSETENFSMPCYTGETRLLTEFFRQKFSALLDEQRQFPIGHLSKRNVELHRPVSFSLRTQARGRGPTDVEGAVVLFVDMEDGAGGHFPGADYKYAIPNDGDYTATVLFNTERLLLAQFVSAFGGVIKDAEFELLRRDGDLPAVVCKKGYITLPHQWVDETVTIPALGANWTVTGTFEFFEANIDMTDALTISNIDNQWKVRLSMRGNLMVRFSNIDDARGEIRDRLVFEDFDLDDFLAPVQADFHYEAELAYSFDPEGLTQLVCESYGFAERVGFQPIFGDIKPPPARDSSGSASEFLGRLVKPAMGRLSDLLRTRLTSFGTSGFITLQDGVVENLKTNLIFESRTSKIASDVLRLNFQSILTGTRLLAPHDIAFFGKVNPAAGYFNVSPMETTLLAGKTTTFKAEPAWARVLWSVEAVSGIAEGVPLSINGGVFTAPSASDMTKSCAHVLVTATNILIPAIQSKALITVVRETLQANPAVVVAQAGRDVDFNAWTLGNPATLQWRYQDEPLGTGQAVTVTSPADTGTVAYVVEEIQVTDPESQQTSTCVLITEMGQLTPMTLSATVDPAGTKAVLDVSQTPFPPEGVNWEVRYGPGSVSAGVYTPGIDETARFALISATFDSGDYGVFEGYVLLVLPLAEHRNITTVQAD